MQKKGGFKKSERNKGKTGKNWLKSKGFSQEDECVTSHSRNVGNWRHKSDSEKAADISETFKV